MEYRLPSGLPHINPKIEAIGPAFLKSAAHVQHQRAPKDHGAPQQSFRTNQRRGVGGSEHMSGSHRKSIKQGESKSILEHDCARMTKRAVLFHRLIFL